MIFYNIAVIGFKVSILMKSAGILIIYVGPLWRIQKNFGAMVAYLLFLVGVQLFGIMLSTKLL